MLLYFEFISKLLPFKFQFNRPILMSLSLSKMMELTEPHPAHRRKEMQHPFQTLGKRYPNNFQEPQSSKSSIQEKSREVVPENSALQTQPRRRVSFLLSVCNTVLAALGLTSAICFGIITIIQSNTANKQAKLANLIAYNSFVMSGIQTCSQSLISAVCLSIYSI
jgi:hypothetical protein